MGANGNKKTTESFAKEVKDLTNGEYVLTGDYIYSNIETTIKHLKCGKEFIVKPTNFCRTYRGIRCPYCSKANNKRKTTKEFQNEVKTINPNIVVLGEYKGNKIKVLMKDLICGRTFESKPNAFLSSQHCRCPLCSMDYIYSSERQAMSLKEAQKKLNRELGNDYKIIGGYVNAHEKCNILHKKCGKIWCAPINSICSGHYHCPYCAPNHSKKEDFILEYLNKNFPNLHPMKLKKKIPMCNKMFEIDIFIPELNIGFEYNGIYWHSTLRKDKSYHKEKQKAFKSMGITLYFLWEHWGIDDCLNIIKHILTKDNQIEVDPYIKMGRKYLYANKDLYPEKPPYIEGYKYIKEIMKPEVVNITDNKVFTIYNSGYYQYIKQ